MSKKHILLKLAIVIIIICSNFWFLTDSFAASPYSIRVNYLQNVVTIYENGQPIKAMVCSTGTATPRSGTYNLNNKYRWLSLVGGVYGQYCTRIVGSILFHSVPYFVNGDPESLEWWEFDNLGTTASAGCIRLQVADAKWIYDNMPGGTPVTFYADDNPGPLGKPISLYVSNLPDYYRCWDPTDPDNNNPWKSFNDVTFKASYYSDRYPDLKAAFGNNEMLLRNHWYKYGIGEGRQASPCFDIQYYLRHYPDLQKAFGKDYYQVYYHFILTGYKERRQTTDSFFMDCYKENYKDLQNAFGNNRIAYFNHYNVYGYKEPRVSMIEMQFYNTIFDAEYYSNKYEDLKLAFGNDKDLLYKHYLEFGIKEGRQAQVTFDVKYYLENNPDVQKVFGKDNYYLAYKHFLEYGINEERVTSQDFNFMIYKENYEDLRKVFGKENKYYYSHYIEFGIKEKRNAVKLLSELDEEALE